MTGASRPAVAAQPVRTVFLGSGAFAVPIAEAVAGHPAVELVGIVSSPDRPAGRRQHLARSPVTELARDHGWPVLQPTRLRSDEAIASVRELGPTLLVLADYGRIVPESLLDVDHGALNVHPSLLPRHRGASPVQATILGGDPETGVTVIRMDGGIDTGPVVARERTAVLAGETAPELEARLAAMGARVLAAALAPWLAGRLVATPQSEAGVTLTRPLRRADGRIDWSHDAASIERQVRAYQPWPGSWTPSPVGTLTVWKAGVAEDGTLRAAGDGPPGTLIPLEGGLAVVTGAGLLQLVEVQPASGRRISGRDLRNGHPGLVGAHLA